MRKQNKHDQYYLFVQFMCSRKFRINPSPEFLLVGSSTMTLLSITAHEKLYLSIASNNPTKKILFIFDNDLTIDHANIRKLFFHCHPTIPQENSFLPPLQENMVFLSQKSRSPSYMCDINFVVSCITVYTGCQYVMFIATYIAM